MKGKVENCNAPRADCVNATGNIKREFSDNEHQKFPCISLDHQMNSSVFKLTQFSILYSYTHVSAEPISVT